MHPRHKKNSIIGLTIGLLLMALGFGLRFFMDSPDVKLRTVSLVIFLIGMPIYIWGCVALARAKGHSTAIVLTVIFGLVFPLLLLLVLPDKLKNRRR